MCFVHSIYVTCRNGGVHICEDDFRPTIRELRDLVLESTIDGLDTLLNIWVQIRNEAGNNDESVWNRRGELLD